MDGKKITKTTTTFQVESSELHLSFKTACIMQKSDMTKELNKFMKRYVEEYNSEGKSIKTKEEDENVK